MGLASYKVDQMTLPLLGRTRKGDKPLIWGIAVPCRALPLPAHNVDSCGAAIRPESGWSRPGIEIVDRPVNDPGGASTPEVGTQPWGYGMGIQRGILYPHGVSPS
jgi:hypothetical protein